MDEVEWMFPFKDGLFGKIGGSVTDIGPRWGPWDVGNPFFRYIGPRWGPTAMDISVFRDIQSRWDRVRKMQLVKKDGSAIPFL